MTRAIAIWLRRGSGLWALPALLCVGLLALFSRGTQWQGEWAWTVDWANGSTILTGPVLAGVVAFDVQKASQAQWLLFNKGLRGGVAVPYHAAIAAWLWATLAHLIAMVVALALTASTGPSGSIPGHAVFFGLLSLAAFAAVGMVIGTFLPRMISAPIALILAFALTIAGANGTIPSVFRAGGVTGTLVGMQYDLRVLAVTGVFLISLTVTVFGVVALRNSPIFATPWAYAGAAALMVGVFSYINLQSEGDFRFRPVNSPPALLCAGSAPQVCMAEGTTRGLQSLAREMDAQASAIRQLGIKVPDVYAQDLPRWRPPQDTGLITLDMSEINAPSADPLMVPEYLATPAACPAYFDASVPPTKALDAKAVLADFIRIRNNLPAMQDLTEQQKSWLNEAAGHEWAVSTFENLKDCQLDHFEEPFQAR